MRKLIKWHKNILAKFMDKLNLGCYEVAWISFGKGILLGIIFILLSGCGVGFKYATLNTAGNVDGIYRSNDYVIEVSDSTKVDTISNLFQLRRKLRTDFNFRWDFAQYQMNQPYSWYFQNRRFNRYSYWRPYSSFDFYFNSHQYWTDWAFNYPFQSNYYSWNRPYWGWNNSWWNGYNSWYNGPWNNPGYNVIWNRSQINDVAYINGRRGSRIADIQDNNKVNRVRPNNNNQVNRIITWSRNNNIPVNTNVLPSDGTRVIKPRGNNNNIRVVPNNNNNNNIRWTPRPDVNTKPVINNSRPPVNNSSNISRGSSSSVKSRGGRGNN